MRLVWWLCACSCGDPAAGELRHDVRGLAARTLLPEGTEEVRWMTQAADGGRGAAGRADARVFAWVGTPAPVSDWLGTLLGEPLGSRPHRLRGDVARVLFRPEELAGLRRDDAKDSWRLGCVRYPAYNLGLGDYRGDVALECEGYLYLVLTAH